MIDSKFMIYSYEKNDMSNIKVLGFADDLETAKDHTKNIIKQFIIKHKEDSNLDKCFIQLDVNLENSNISDGYYVKNWENKYILLHKQSETKDVGGWIIRATVKQQNIILINSYNITSFNKQLLDNNTLNDTQDSTSNYSYRRINHFTKYLEYLNKDTVDIPQEIYDKITNELNNRGLNDTSKLNVNRIKKILADLHLKQYYEYSHNITYKLKGKDDITLSAETELQLKMMFKSIQKPFTEYIADTDCRKTSFLPYSYVIHKFCQILELHDIIELFPLSPSIDKLKYLDKVWYFICCKLNWKYYPSNYVDDV